MSASWRSEQSSIIFFLVSALWVECSWWFCLIILINNCVHFSTLLQRICKDHMITHGKKVPTRGVVNILKHLLWHKMPGSTSCLQSSVIVLTRLVLLQSGMMLPLQVFPELETLELALELLPYISKNNDIQRSQGERGREGGRGER